MGSKRIGLARTQALIENLKRELRMGDTTFTNITVQGPATSTYGAGAVSGSTTPPETKVVEVNGEIITTVTIDLQHLSASAADGAVIGNKEAGIDNTASAHFLRWSLDTNGICTSVSLHCIEDCAGNGGDNALDIDIERDSATKVQGSTSLNALVLNTGVAPLTAGTGARTLQPGAIADNDYLYLTTGAAPGATGGLQYSGGKLVIKFTGYKDF